jgi:superfamily II DNA helicase RecQ
MEIGSPSILSRVFEQTKHCPKCKKHKIFSYFGKDNSKSLGLSSYCLACTSETRRANYAKNLDVEKQKLRSYYRSNKEKSVGYSLKALYGLTLDEYKKMQVQQNHACKICKTHESNLKRRLFVDHCHETGKVRGLLCQYCNTMLGNAKDNVLVLQSAISYLSDGS